MPNTPTPLNMTREQQREIKQLTARLRAIDIALEKQALAASAKVASLDSQGERIRRALMRAHARSIARMEKNIRALKRPALKHLNRIMAGRAPENKERAAVVRRIALLEGRLNS